MIRFLQVRRSRESRPAPVEAFVRSVGDEARRLSESIGN
jgi:hypothetical protein